MIYLDTSYIAKCYLNEPGTDDVLAWLDGKTGLSCCLHGRLEFFSAVKRHVRERHLSEINAKKVFSLFNGDELKGIWCWLPVNEDLIKGACRVVESLPRNAFLRSADALHLMCARDNGFECVYSNDRHMLDAAEYFGLRGRNIISG